MRPGRSLPLQGRLLEGISGCRDRGSLRGGAAGRFVPVGVALLLALTGCAVGTQGVGGRPAADVDSTPTTVNIANCEGFSVAGTPDPDGLPQLRLRCLAEGPDLDLATIGGRPTLVNLWASWCQPCREEMPLIQAAYENYGDRVGFLGVNVRDGLPGAIAFLNDNGMTYAHVVDVEGELMTRLGIPGLPVTLAINSAGRVFARHVGPLSPGLLADLMARLLADEP